MPTFESGARTIHIDVAEPPGPGPFPAVLLLHGSGGNIRFWLDRLAPHAARLGIAIYAVHYFDRTGTDRADVATITDGHHFPLWLSTVHDAVTWIAARPAIDARRIALLGISLGAFLALALAAEDRPGPRLRALIEISGGLPEPLANSVTAAFPPTLILHGDADSVVPVRFARDLDTRLTAAGVHHRTHLFPGEGHWFSLPTQFQILAAVGSFLSTWLTA